MVQLALVCSTALQGSSSRAGTGAGAVVEKALLPMYQEVESVEISTGAGESSGHEQGGPTLE